MCRPFVPTLGDITALRIALAQINCTVGDLYGNTEKICHYVREARGHHAQVVVFPELAVTGYPPEDLLLKPRFVSDNLECIERIAKESLEIMSVVGFVDRTHVSGQNPALEPSPLYNSAALCGGGRVLDRYHKMRLPNYGVFDEKRYFTPGDRCAVFVLPGQFTVGINVCEDIWDPNGPALVQARRGGAKLILNCNSSPYHTQKWKLRQEMLSQRARDNGVHIAYVNLVGGQDELVFDGHSLIFAPDGQLIVQASQFKEELIVVDIPISPDELNGTTSEEALTEVTAVEGKSCRRVNISGLSLDFSQQTPGISNESPRLVAGGTVETMSYEEEVYSALVLGLGDYVRKNGFSGVVLGLSGGIDSSLVAAIAVDALGAANVVGVNLPSEFSSAEGIEDAYLTATKLGIECKNIPIKPVHELLLAELADEFAGTPSGLAEENLQARIRGNILMALSNKFGWMLLTTGNKSEMACGYATLYGDMAGGFAAIKDVPKTLVYELARWRNRIREVIPQRVIDKAPSAELRPGQRDQDSLPPYEVLDPILQAYVEYDQSYDEIVARGFEGKVVAQVIQLVDRSEYKRRQAPPGVKITPKAFGKDRRMPITNRYRASGGA